MPVMVMQVLEELHCGCEYKELFGVFRMLILSVLPFFFLDATPIPLTPRRKTPPSYLFKYTTPIPLTPFP